MNLRIRKTYRSLHNAFVELLEEKCFEDLTVNELCDRAMIRRTTFYKHFADKYEYFTFYILEVVATFQDSLARM
jgi:AcrR family transcriptional regulator